MAVVALNLLVNLILVWPLAELGLAISTALAAALQTGLLALTFSRAVSRLSWSALSAALANSAAASAAMGAVVWAVALVLDVGAAGSRPAVSLQLAGMIAAGVVVYLLAARLLGMPELWLLFSPPNRDEQPRDRTAE
jgi:putative peptidoglycan lipid II flippase